MGNIMIDAGHLHFRNKLWLNELSLFINEFSLHHVRIVEILLTKKNELDFITNLEKEYLKMKVKVETLRGEIANIDQNLKERVSVDYSGYYHNKHKELAKKMDMLKEQYTYMKNQLSYMLENFAYSEEYGKVNQQETLAV
ncbi:hypothetical protein R9C00_10865 [Flammeovirgaceae bacterium SG7u.111]|nr:hypothetical protein [Flammeovirgaceae bacterium SG7u.132]WPO37953.1 hypothetical protein R9C00_10865 [Flammeovirgaceae bacterium SG7u.111]